MRVVPSTAFGEGITFGTQGSAMMGDEDGVRDRMVVIKVFLSDAFTKSDLSLLNARLKNTLAHEFTHGGQPEDLLVTSGEAQMSAMRKGLKTLEAISAYYLDAAEVEAFARGMYKQAKMTKTPFHKMVDVEIARNLAFYAHPKEIALAEYSEEEITSFFENEYRQALLDYARKNLPAAVLENQDFISSLREMIKEEMDEWKPTGEEMMFPAIYLTSHMGEYDKEPHWKEWRKKSDEEKFAWAEKMDFSEPVEITVFADGTFAHGDGHHRVMAGKVLDIEIPIIITRNKLKEYEEGVWEKWLNAALHKSPKQLNPEGYNLKTMETLDYILNPREQKENNNFTDIDTSIEKKAEANIPAVLYHATYGPLADSIQREGLGGDRDTVWEDSVRGTVYLALDPEIAFSYAETSDDAWDRFETSDGLEIVTFQIDTSQLDPAKFNIDQNVIDNDGDTLEYYGIIPPFALKVVKRGYA